MKKTQTTKLCIKEVNDYLAYAKKNPNRISDDVKLLIKNIVIPTLERDDIFFDEETYHKCISFCEKWFYPLFPFQKFRYAFVFMYKKENRNIVIFDDLFDVMGRGNGKDGYVIPLVLFLLTPAYGIRNYNIDIVATSEGQAIDTFSIAYNMLEQNMDLMKKHFYWNKTVIMNKVTKSKLVYNTSSAKTKDGKRSGMIVFNELHAYEDYKQLNTFSSGLGKTPHARTWTITTDGTVRDGPLDEKKALANDILNGRAGIPGMFPFICRMSNEEDCHKPMAKFLKTGKESDIDFTLWEQANPSVQFLPELRNQIQKDYQKMMKQSSFKVEFFTKRMNVIKENEDEVVASWEDITRAISEDLPDLKGKPCIGTLDFSDTRDFTSCGLLFNVDGKKYFIQQSFTPQENPNLPYIKINIDECVENEWLDILPGKTQDAHKIAKWFCDKGKIYDIKAIACDNWRLNDIRAAFDEEGIKEKTKDNPYGLLVGVRSGEFTHSRVANRIQSDFIEGNVSFGKDKLMRWYIWNTGVKKTKKGNLDYFKIEPKLRKNDGFMSFVHGYSLIEEIPQSTVSFNIETISF